MFVRLPGSQRFRFRVRAAARNLVNVQFAFRYRHLRKSRKIIYALQPRPGSPNIGDHAQTIAIRGWIQKHYPNFPVVELSRDDTEYFLPALRWLTNPVDVILLQSGGNMGDFRKRAERIRLSVIQTFPRNRIVSLPQTIRFDDEAQTKAQRDHMCRIYNRHPNLTILARDPISDGLARRFLPNCRVMFMPDFVLSTHSEQSPTANSFPRVLLCLRDDDGSRLTPVQRQEIKAHLPYSSMFFDTCGRGLISERGHEGALRTILETVRRFDVVVTDRFHGLIFSVVCRKPCVALHSSGHKMIGGYEWLRDLPFVRFAQTPDDIPELVEQCLGIEDRRVPDWNALYFDRIPDLLDLN